MRTKIVVTLGPATRDPGVIRQLIEAGTSVFRLNFSHGTPEEHEAVVRLVREAAAETGRAIALLGDLQGPKIRTGPLAAGRVALRAGARLLITTRAVPGDAEAVSTTYEGLPRYIDPGQRLMLDDGRLELRVQTVSAEDIACVVVQGGELRSHVGINLPDVRVEVPSLTEKDLEDLDRCIGWGLDYVALSFVQVPADVAPLRAALRARRVQIPAIAKIEKPSAMEHLDGILRAFDGVMVARGDLAVETSFAEVPVFQKRIIAAANALGKPVITATQMLESMTHAPRPTRAEASDVANAVWDGTDAVMLSGETAIGEHPVLTVRAMAAILREAEGHRGAPAPLSARLPDAAAVVHAACDLASHAGGSALVVLTQSGRTALLAARERPGMAIVAITDSEAVRRRLALYWGVEAFLMPFVRDTDEMLARVEAFLLSQGVARSGETVVFTGAAPVAVKGGTNFVKVQRVRGSL